MNNRQLNCSGACRLMSVIKAQAAIPQINTTKNRRRMLCWLEPIGEFTHLGHDESFALEPLGDTNDVKNQNSQSNHREKDADQAAQSATDGAKDHRYDLQTDKQHKFSRGQNKSVLRMPLHLGIVFFHEKRNQRKEPQV